MLVQEFIKAAVKLLQLLDLFFLTDGLLLLYYIFVVMNMTVVALALATYEGRAERGERILALRRILRTQTQRTQQQKECA